MSSDDHTTSENRTLPSGSAAESTSRDRRPMGAETKRRASLVVALLVISGTIVALDDPYEWFSTASTTPPPPDDIPDWALENPAAPGFQAGGAWLNTDGEPISLQDLQGSVVLVDFWTYSCINCIHTFPYLNAWHERYEGSGLTIIGVHTPEFRFERETANVQSAIDKYDLEHPVVQDNDYGIWKAYHNRYWPAKYLIDEWGRIRYSHFGEGAYDETESKIRQLLAETGADVPVFTEPIDPDGGFSHRDQSPEWFTSDLRGPARNGIRNPEGFHSGETIDYGTIESVDEDGVWLTGTWKNDGDHIESVDPGATVILSFQAGAANFVADFAGDGDDRCVEVFLDGEPITDKYAARDVDASRSPPCIEIDGPRSYDFYGAPFGHHVVVFDVPEGFQLYSFAFSADARK